ncbi:MAG: T9SS type A sorting domain-containing protein [Bacteroidia bacterium]|nr:T9SS type A sorting domain-containing protein [Bacteroidia bacterium]
MKKLLLSLSVCALSFQFASAQTTLTTAVNITGTDIDGNPYDLFTSLNAGKYVVVDFLFTTCGPCQNCAPKLWQAFTNYGCNGPGSQIEFISINRDDNNAVMHSWEASYMNATGPYPIGFSGTQGSATGRSQTFHTTYGITAFPTMILIAPNKTILEQDMWPINTAADFTTYFQAHGLNPTPCAVGVTETEKAENSFSVSPVPAANRVTFKSSVYQLNEIKIVDLMGKTVYSSKPESDVSSVDVDITTLEAGVYFAEVNMNGTIVKRKFVKA